MNQPTSNAKLNLSNDYAIEVLSYYLWGQATPPTPDQIADPKWITDRKSITVDIDAREYMEKTGLGNFNPYNFKLIRRFFKEERELGAQSWGTTKLRKRAKITKLLKAM